jgi:hypothetical protein
MMDAGPSGFEGGMTNRKYARLTGARSAIASGISPIWSYAAAPRQPAAAAAHATGW